MERKSPRAICDGSVFNKNGLPPRREEWQWAMRSVPSLWHPLPSLPRHSTGLESYKSESRKTCSKAIRSWMMGTGSFRVGGQAEQLLCALSYVIKIHKQYLSIQN